jgi:hypothetical protein
VDYFASIGESCGAHENPAEFFMKMLSKETLEHNIDESAHLTDAELEDSVLIEEKYEKRIDKLSKKYQNSTLKCTLKSQNNPNNANNTIKRRRRSSRRHNRTNRRACEYVKIPSRMVLSIQHSVQKKHIKHRPNPSSLICKINNNPDRVLFSSGFILGCNRFHI